MISGTPSTALSESFRDRVKGSVILSTCNRTEIYFISEKNADFAEQALADVCGVDISLLRRYIRIYPDGKGEKHLFRVAAGMESMLFGEDEILRQVKEAYDFSLKNHLSCYEINRLFQAAIHCAKEIKTNTKIAYLPLSVSTISANLCRSFAVENAIQNAKILVVGATGKIGSATVKNLLSMDCFDITATTRTHNSLAATFPKNIRTVDYKERYSFVDECDMIISATSSLHYIFTADMLNEKIRSQKPRLMIDLAVPRDIDSLVRNIENIRLFDIDYFRSKSEQNDKLRQGESVSMNEIISEHLDTVKKDMILHEYRSQHSDGEDSETMKYIYRLKSSLSAENFKRAIGFVKEAI